MIEQFLAEAGIQRYTLHKIKRRGTFHSSIKFSRDLSTFSYSNYSISWENLLKDQSNFPLVIKY